jgi:hypothetical protein
MYLSTFPSFRVRDNRLDNVWFVREIPDALRTPWIRPQERSKLNTPVQK